MREGHRPFWFSAKCQKRRDDVSRLFFFGGDCWTRTSDLLRVKEFAEDGSKPLRSSWLRFLTFGDLQHVLQMDTRSHRTLPDEATVYDTSALWYSSIVFLGYMLGRMTSVLPVRLWSKWTAGIKKMWQKTKNGHKILTVWNYYWNKRCKSDYDENTRFDF